MGGTLEINKLGTGSIPTTSGDPCLGFYKGKLPFSIKGLGFRV